MNMQTRVAGYALLAGLLLSGGGAWVSACHAETQAPPKDAAGGQRLERDGVAVEFQLRPAQPGGQLVEGSFADVRFSLTDSASGQPLAGVAPGAWVDPQQSAADQAQGRDRSCKSRVGAFLKSSVGARPMLDLNSYYVFIMNQDASVSIVDPSVSVGGITSTLGRIDLKQPPMDWVSRKDNKRIFVSMPTAGEVAVIDAEKFRLIDSIPAGKQPVRVALQPDERLLWVGNNAGDAAEAGVTVIDVQTLEPLKHLVTGRGHHEISFSQDSRFAFVSNRDDGTLSVIDVASLSIKQQLKTGSHPLSVAYSALSQAVYVADGKDGTITVIDGQNPALRKVIKSRQGLGPMGFSTDGRFGIVLNTLENRVAIIDAATDSLIHEVEVSAEPYQVVFSKAYAYIRGLASSKVTMINLSSLGQGRTPIVQGFEAGSTAPRLAGDLPLASGLAISRDENSVFVVNPADNTTYFYAEGMNAPMSGYPNRGQVARAAMVIDRSLREVEPGVYSSRIKLPPAGAFDVAFLLNQPSIVHCFSVQVQADSQVARHLGAPSVDFLLEKSSVPLGSPFVARFRIAQDAGKLPRIGVKDVEVRYFLAPTSRVQVVAAKEVSDGVYEAPLTLDKSGAWYVHVRAASLGADFATQSFASVRVVPGAAQ